MDSFKKAVLGDLGKDKRRVYQPKLEEFEQQNIITLQIDIHDYK